MALVAEDASVYDTPMKHTLDLEMSVHRKQTVQEEETNIKKAHFDLF